MNRWSGSCSSNQLAASGALAGHRARGLWRPTSTPRSKTSRTTGSVRFLLDTHVFLWLASDDPQLTPAARAIFVDHEQECFLSAARVWAMAIKSSLGKLTIAMGLERLVRGGLERGL